MGRTTEKSKGPYFINIVRFEGVTVLGLPRAFLSSQGLLLTSHLPWSSKVLMAELRVCVSLEEVCKEQDRFIWDEHNMVETLHPQMESSQRCDIDITELPFSGRERRGRCYFSTTKLSEILPQGRWTSCVPVVVIDAVKLP